MKTKQFHHVFRSLPTPYRKQQGVVFFVALIVMVAMALAAVALVRSVDTANIVAGNQAFKQGALNATDRGVALALNKFDSSTSGALSTESATHADSTNNCYRSTTFQPTQLDARGVPKLLVNPTTAQSPFAASFDTTYTGCKSTNATTGETIRYIIDRQCTSTIAGIAPTNADCNVVSTSTSGRTDDDLHTGSETVPLYRVTVRVDGPRNTVSFAQVIFRP